MYLHVQTFTDVSASRLEYDEHIAATVEWERRGSAARYYYRLVGRDVLVEIGVEPATHALCKLNVVTFSGLGTRPFPGGPIISGLPVFDEHPEWTDAPAYVDAPAPVEIAFVDSSLVVTVEPIKQATTIYDAGRAMFACGPNQQVQAISVPLSGDHLDRLRLIAG